MAVLNELNPVLGLELTATPQTQKGSITIPFKNVVYEYPLGAAMRDGFVKEPSVVTRKDFDPTLYSQIELDRIKLEDGIRIHENIKPDIEIYCRNNDLDRVKPFVLVVAKDTAHANQLIDLIKQQNFFGGYYADKVMEIHSNQKGSEKDENIQQLLKVEDPENLIEIVIHVNMLKEGWDVTNLYTIIPLRTSASATLTEQTIGRGLRLPFGRRMNNDAMDKLYIVSHDKFQAIIEEANKPDSIIRATQIISIEDLELEENKEVIVSYDTFNENLNEEKNTIQNSNIPENEKEKRILQEIDLVKKVSNQLHSQNTIHSTDDLKKDEVKQAFIERVKKEIAFDPQTQLFVEDLDEKIKSAIDKVFDFEIKHSIKIPRISVVPDDDFDTGFHDFDLDTRNLRFSEVTEDLHEKVLNREEGIRLLLKGGRHRRGKDLRTVIVTELINYNEIDYDDQSDLLYKLSKQAIQSIKIDRKDEVVNNIVWNRRKNIAEFIYTQMKPNFYFEAKRYKTNISTSFSEIKQHNISKVSADKIYHYSETIKPASRIKQCIFSGFEKSCHAKLKFDSKSEKDFAFILEEEADSPVIKWLRPATLQFNIWWGVFDQRQYEPDFVTETEKSIYLIEIKAEKDIDSDEVKRKAQAAIKYCKLATEYNLKYGEKPWKYVIIPHNKITMQMGFNTLVEQFEKDE